MLGTVGEGLSLGQGLGIGIVLGVQRGDLGHPSDLVGKLKSGPLIQELLSQL